MDTMAAFMMGEANRGKEQKIFDWDKAAEIIRDRKPILAIAGLKEDMEWTSGAIYQDGEPIYDYYTYLASTWATPILQIQAEENAELEDIPCYRMASEVPHWNAETKWPQSALDILMKGKEANEAVC